MPAPVVLGIGTGNGAGNSSLGRDGVRAGGEHFGNDSGFVARFGQLQGSAHDRTAATNDDAVIRNCSLILESQESFNTLVVILHVINNTVSICIPQTQT